MGESGRDQAIRGTVRRRGDASLPGTGTADARRRDAGQAQPTVDAAARASEVRDDLAQMQLQAIDHMTKKYQDEVDSK